MKTLVNANVIPNSRLEKSILKEKLLIQIKALRDKAIVARNTREEIRLNAEYEKLLTSSCIEDNMANDKTPVTSSRPQNKPKPDDKKKVDKKKDGFDYSDNPDNEDWTRGSFLARLADLIKLNQQTKP